MATLTVQNLRAKDLPKLDRDGSDPFLELTMGRTRHRTRYVMNTSTPTWTETFTIPITSPFLQVSVWDNDGKDRAPQALGQGSVSLAQLKPGPQEIMVDLEGPGSVTMEIEMPDDDDADDADAGELSPTDAELKDLSAACSRLWRLDDNRLHFGKDLEIDLQQRAAYEATADRASEPLFKRVDPSTFERPTYGALRALLNNFEADVGSEEVATKEEMQEIQAFLAAVIDTQPMKYCHQYLTKLGRVGPSQQAFRALLNGLWFDLYGRGGRMDSCGFEHVFCGEQKNGAVIGFHNWVKFMTEEAAGRVDYRGFTFAPRHNDPGEDDPTPHLISIKFGWEDDDGAATNGLPVKSISSLFIGTSPEFELALYTLCFLTGHEENRVKVGSYDVKVVCHPIQRAGRTYIGTVYPEA